MIVPKNKSVHLRRMTELKPGTIYHLFPGGDTDAILAFNVLDSWLSLCGKVWPSWRVGRTPNGFSYLNESGFDWLKDHDSHVCIPCLEEFLR